MVEAQYNNQLAAFEQLLNQINSKWGYASIPEGGTVRDYVVWSPQLLDQFAKATEGMSPEEALSFALSWKSEMQRAFPDQSENIDNTYWNMKDYINSTLAIEEEERVQIPEQGQIEIKCVPDAIVIYEGQSVGSASLSLPYIASAPAGQYEFILRRTGYKDRKITAYVKEGEVSRHSVTLDEEYAGPEPTPEPSDEYALVYVPTNPSGATIYLDGVTTWLFTPATIRVPIGIHIIRVQLEGYYPLEVEIEVTE